MLCLFGLDPVKLCGFGCCVSFMVVYIDGLGVLHFVGLNLFSLVIIWCSDRGFGLLLIIVWMVHNQRYLMFIVSSDFSLRFSSFVELVCGFWRLLLLDCYSWWQVVHSCRLLYNSIYYHCNNSFIILIVVLVLLRLYDLYAMLIVSNNLFVFVVQLCDKVVLVVTIVNASCARVWFLFAL